VTGATPIRFSAVVLAAGLSTRMEGRHKLVLSVEGEPAIRRTVRAILDAQPEEVVVVTGHEEPAVREALAGLPIRVHRNPRYAEGQATSVAAGVAALTQAVDAALVCLGDMVLLTAQDYREVVGAYGENLEKSILVPHFQGRRGNPVLIAEWRLPQVISGHSNPGCRKLIEENPDDVYCYPAAHDRFISDMDTPQDYEDVLRRLAPAESPAGERE
jgi:molybdenum cofactor cytidylyltransferase